MKFNFSFIWFQPSVSSCLGRAVRAPANRTHLLLGCQAGQSAARLPLCSHHSSHSSFGSHRTSSYWQVFQKMWTSGDKSAAQIVKDLDLGMVKDTARLHSICQKVVDAHPNEVRGQPSIMCFKWLVQFLGLKKKACLLCLGVGSGHQKRKQESTEQTDGPGSEGDQR